MIDTSKKNNQATQNDVNGQAAQKTDAAAQDIAAEVAQLQEQIANLEEKVTQAKEAQMRSQADYQNLQRRSQEERGRWTKLATRDLMTDLLQPLDHLGMAAAELKDPGLDMTIKQFWQVFELHGLQEIMVMGQDFDPNLMEVVKRQGVGEKVIKVVRRGYNLNGEVIQHAKVIVGDSKTDAQSQDENQINSTSDTQL